TSMEATDPLPIPVYITFTIALMGNIILLLVYFCCPLKNIKSYKYFFLLTAVGDICYSAVFVLTMPRVVSQCSSMVFVATGAVSQDIAAFILLIVFCGFFFCSVLFVTNSFIYRYVQLCRSQLFEKLSLKKTIFVASSVNIFVVLNLYIAIYIVFWPDKDFEQMISGCVGIPGMTAARVVFLGFSIKYRISELRLALIIDFLFLMASMGFINILCATKINGFLSSASQNGDFLSLQRRMFLLLLLQTTIPFTCLLAPCFFALFLLLTGIESTTLITNVISLLLITYPVLNPVIIIAFLNECKNFVLIKLRFKKPVGLAVSPQFKTNATKPISVSSQTVVMPQLFNKLSTKRTMSLGILINSLILSNVLAIMCTAFWPGEDFINFVVSTVDIPGVNISDATFVGFSPKFVMDAFHIALIIELALLLAFIGSINIYCAKKIKAFLKEVARSSNFLTLQRQMYALLLVQ
ncbi:7TM chemoreceptor, partial [Trichostrongylus colubriformis]